MGLGSTDEQKPAMRFTVEALGRAENNPDSVRHRLKRDQRGNEVRYKIFI